MNWRKSNRELVKLYARNPWLYVIEWRERLERCVLHLSDVHGLNPDEVGWETGHLRELANGLLRIADDWERRSAKAQRIEALRNTKGRTPEEASMYLRKADELEGTS